MTLEARDGELSASRPRSLLSNGAWSLSLNVWQAVVAFILTPFIIGRIGSGNYGLLVLLLTISSFMGLMNLGLGDATLRYVAHYYGKNDLSGINRVVGATVSVYLVAGVCSWALLHLSSPLLAGAFRIPGAEMSLAVTLLQITAINVGLGFVSGAFAAIPQALQRYDLSTIIVVAQSVFQTAGTIAILLLGGSIRELVLWGIATTVFTQTVSLLVVKRLVPRICLRPSPSRRGLREVFGYGMFSLLTHALGLLWGQADRLILGAISGTTAVAYLSVPQQFSFRGTGAVASLGAGLFPKFSGDVGRDEVRRLFLVATWVMLAGTVVLFVPLTALFPDLLRLWIDAEFANRSAWLAQIIAFSCIVRGAFVPYDALFRGLGKPQFMTLVFSASALTSLVLNLVLIPIYGLSGAGYCYVATTVWGFLALGFAWRKVLEVPSFRPLVRAVVLPVLIGWGMLAVCVLVRRGLAEPGWLVFIGLFVSGALGTAALMAGAELLLGGRSSHVAALLVSVRRLSPILRSPRCSASG